MMPTSVHLHREPANFNHQRHHDRRQRSTTRQHYRPEKTPVETWIDRLWQAAEDGRIRYDDARCGVRIMKHLEPDRYGNFRTIGPLTDLMLADALGFSVRKVLGIRKRLRDQFPGFNWRKTEDGNIYRMGPDGQMVGAPSRKTVHDAKVSTKEKLPVKEVDLSLIVVVEEKGEPARAAALPPEMTKAERLAAFRADPPASVLVFGISNGLTERQVRRVIGKFADHYTAHPDRLRTNDLVALICGRIWLQRDAARAAAARAHKPKPDFYYDLPDAISPPADLPEPPPHDVIPDCCEHSAAIAYADDGGDSDRDDDSDVATLATMMVPRPRAHQRGREFDVNTSLDDPPWWSIDAADRTMRERFERTGLWDEARRDPDADVDFAPRDLATSF